MDHLLAHPNFRLLQCNSPNSFTAYYLRPDVTPPSFASGGGATAEEALRAALCSAFADVMPNADLF